MSSILILGVGPLPIDASTKLHAPGLRTWHIVDLLARRKHRIMLGLIEFGDFAGDNGAAIFAREEYGERITICRMRYNPDNIGAALATLHLSYKFQAIIATTDIMNSLAAELPMRVPLWLDYNGDPHAEKQLQGYVHQHDGAQLRQWQFFLKGLIAGDRFSTCSEPQKHALIGQLGFAGRLNQFTAGEKLVYSIPNCSRALLELSGVTATLLKSRFIPADSLILMWLGGYNSWSDPDTLFAGVELAMKRLPNLYYVSTGGEIAGHDSETFARFREQVDASPFVSRFMFLGWLPTNEIPSYIRQADACVCIDRHSYEGELGTRTRILDWMQFEVPIISTVLSELTRTLREKQLITTFEVGSPESLAEAIVAVMRDRELAKARAIESRQFFRQEFDDEKVFAPMIEWVENPTFAGDRKDVPTTNSQPLPNSRLAADHIRMTLPERQTAGSATSRPSSLRRLLRKLAGR